MNIEDIPVKENKVPIVDTRYQLSAEEFNTVVDALKTTAANAITAFSERIGASFFNPADYILYHFKDNDDLNLWLNGGGDGLIIGQTPFSFTGTINQLKVVNYMPSNTLYYTTNSTEALITVGFISQVKGITDQEWQEVAEDAFFTISVDKGNGGTWTDIITNQRVSTGKTITFDVRRHLLSGANRVRVSAVGETTGSSANLIYQVTLTSMYLSPSKFAWNVPFIEGNTYNLGGVNIGGAIPKILKVNISSDSGYSKLYEKNIGTQTYTTNAYFFKDLEFPTAGSGVYHTEMWLDANGFESDHLKYDIICVSTADATTAKFIVVNEVADEAVNYGSGTIFKYATYDSGATLSNPSFELLANIDGVDTVVSSESLTNVPTGVANSYATTLEIDSESSDLVLTVNAHNGNTATVTLPVNNTASFPATSGASFYMQPANRSNSQPNYEKVINAVNGKEISATWTNMSWVEGTDGWTTDDDGKKCLRIPATCKVDINYKPLGSYNGGKTIELTFKIKNASNYNEPVISICNDPTSDKFLGLLIKPDNVTLHSRDLNVSDMVQGYNFKDEELVNMQITIIRNYKTNYGNFAIIYVNGVKKCTFAFNTNDNWITSSNVIIGSQTADVFIYNMRVYEKGFGMQDAMMNWVNSLPSASEKVAADALINAVVDDSFNVDYEKTALEYNTMVVEMLDGAELPHYGLSKDYKALCNLEMNYADQPSWNFKMNSVRIEGQGTTSMNYFLWNLRFRADKEIGSVVYSDGSVDADGKAWFDGANNHPKVDRITAKKNYASSMQSHKMGATAAYNDLHKHLGLSNEVNGLVAVYQYPVYGFQKIRIEGTDMYTYKFIGMFTIGPDKGDKATFGFDNKAYKNTIINLEGTDHSIKGVGFDYPWSGLKYVASEESICVDRGTTFDAAWEVGNCGSAETEEEIQAYLDQEFKPAYEVVYNNSTMIKGTTETLATINADVDAWGLRKDEDGHAYQRFEFWIDGEYDILYLNMKSGKYEKNGINLLTQLNISTSELDGLTLEQKNELFCEKRREKFLAEVADYWDIDDVIYHNKFTYLIAASDNLMKNYYPQKFGTLASGSRWGLRQDDLDSIFRTDNQGHPSKKYSVEQYDWTDTSKTAYVFKGEQSRLVRLMDETFANENELMGKRILQAMTELSKYGTTTIDKLEGFFQTYFFDKAQDYFTKSCYNADAEYTYEEAYPKYVDKSYDVDVNPLEQSLGDSKESEKSWLLKRMIYAMSKYLFGPFQQYNDTCLGRINFRTQLAQSFTISPAIDLYPAILSGQGSIVSSGKRIEAYTPILLSGVGGTNTNVYIMAADWLADIGDLSTLTVDASTNAGISVGGKRLVCIKVGDVDASKVTSNLQTLNVGSCPSLEWVDAQNLSSLTGTVDLTGCPRLQYALFGGTDIRNIVIPNGSKIYRLQLSDALTVISLLNLRNLTTDGMEFNDLSKVEYLRVENSTFDSFKLLRAMYATDGNSIRDIRIVGLKGTGDYSDADVLKNIANDLDKDGNAHEYNGIDAEGVQIPESIPVIEGEISIAGPIYEDTLENIEPIFPNLNLVDYDSDFYMRFVDSEIGAIMADEYGDGNGMRLSEVSSLSQLRNALFVDKTIHDFSDLERFVNLEEIGNSVSSQGVFYKSALEIIKLPDSTNKIYQSSFEGCANLHTIHWSAVPVSFAYQTGYPSSCDAFNGCTSLKNVHIKNLSSWCVQDFPDADSNPAYYSKSLIYNNETIREINGLNDVTFIGQYAFIDNTSLVSIELSNATEIRNSSFDGCTSLQTIVAPNITSLGSSAFRNCSSLQSISFPLATTIGGSAFNSCVALYQALLPNVITLNDSAFYGCSSLQSISMPLVTSILTYTFYNCTSLKSVIMESVTEILNGAFNGCSNLSEISFGNITTIGNEVFRNCEKLQNIDLSSLQSIGTGAFYGCKELESLSIPSGVSIIPDSLCYRCESLSEITLPDTITSIGTSAFEYCKEITNISIPSSVAELKNSVFAGCTSLRSIEIPDSVTSFGSSVFNGCTDLTHASILADIKKLPSNTFNNTTSLESVSLSDDIEEIDASAFASSGIKEITLPKNLKVLAGRSFQSSKLSTIKWCDGVVTTSIVSGVGVFSGTNILNVYITNVTNWCESTWSDSSCTPFYGGNGIMYLNDEIVKDLIIPNDVSRVRAYSFYRVNNIEKVDIPISVSYIGSYAFQYCKSLTEIHVRAATPPTLGSGAFDGNSTGRLIYVPMESVDAYKTATNWSKYADYIVGE